SNGDVDFAFPEPATIGSDAGDRDVADARGVLQHVRVSDQFSQWTHHDLPNHAVRPCRPSGLRESCPPTSDPAGEWRRDCTFQPPSGWQDRLDRDSRSGVTCWITPTANAPEIGGSWGPGRPARSVATAAMPSTPPRPKTGWRQ